jgi:phosphoribosyl 1,2-cyclic phosphodiesterase
VSGDFSIQSLASGSGGNCWLLTAGETRFLIDAGLSAKQIVERLMKIGVEPASIEGVLITHEHSDHISAVPVLSRRLGLKTFIVEAAAKVSRRRNPSLMEEYGVRVEPIEAGVPMTVRDVTIRPFSVSHDSVDPVMFTFEYHSSKLGFATDLGIVTRLVSERLRGLDALVIESNHDVKMLADGPYRPEDKRRIKGRLGHLSNDEAQTLVREIAHAGLRSVTLAHLSQINNAPSLAFEGMRRVLDEACASCELHVASQYEIGRPVVINKAVSG